MRQRHRPAFQDRLSSGFRLKLNRRAVLVGAAAGVVGGAASAEHPNVDLQLVLAVDCSGSVNQTRYELQRKGYAEAFRSPEVINAIRSGREGAIAVSMTQWTGPMLQSLTLPWRRISNADDAEATAELIHQMPRILFSGGTSISGAIDHGATLFASSPFPTRRRVIDVSGDGANNRGRAAREARDDAVRAGITINGLPILALEPHLDTYYRDHVIGGDTAFMVVAESYEMFAGAVRRKLIQEIADGMRAPRTAT
jgi:hypothetical protein